MAAAKQLAARLLEHVHDAKPCSDSLCCRTAHPFLQHQHSDVDCLVHAVQLGDWRGTHREAADSMAEECLLGLPIPAGTGTLVSLHPTPG